MPRRTPESDGYVPNELSFQVIPGSDTRSLLNRLNKMTSVTEVKKIFEGDSEIGDFFLVKVNPRLRSRVSASIKRDSSVNEVHRVAIRETQELL